MKTELFRAYDAYLTAKRPTVVAAMAKTRVPFPAGGGGGNTGVVDIAGAAGDVLETRYGTAMNVASTSPAQAAKRAPFVGAGPGQNLFDIAGEPDRSRLTGKPDLAPDVAWWLFDNDTPGAANATGARRFATDITAAHHYAAQDDPGGAFRWQVANEYAVLATLPGGNRRQLIDYRVADWSESGPVGITVNSRSTPGGKSRRRRDEAALDDLRDHRSRGPATSARTRRSSPPSKAAER
jgi:hypothetical protein